MAEQAEQAGQQEAEGQKQEGTSDDDDTKKKALFSEDEVIKDNENTSTTTAETAGDKGKGDTGNEDTGTSDSTGGQKKEKAYKYISPDGDELNVESKYWDSKKEAPNLAAILKSNRDLQVKVNSQTSIPENYEITDLKSDNYQTAGVKEDSTGITEFKDNAKKLGLTQEQFNGVLGMIVGWGKNEQTLLKGQQDKIGVYLGDESGISKFKDEVLSFAKAITQGNQEAREALYAMTKTLGGVQLLELFKAASQEQRMPSNKTSTPRPENTQNSGELSAEAVNTLIKEENEGNLSDQKRELLARHFIARSRSQSSAP